MVRPSLVQVVPAALLVGMLSIAAVRCTRGDEPGSDASHAQRLRILPHTHSPLQDKYPQAMSTSLCEKLLHLSISESDNVATDIVLRLIGSPSIVNSYINSIEVSGFHLEDG